MSKLEAAFRGIKKLNFKSPALAILVFIALVERRLDLIKGIVPLESYDLYKNIFQFIFFIGFVVLLYLDSENREKISEDRECRYGFYLYACISLVMVYFLIK